MWGWLLLNCFSPCLLHFGVNNSCAEASCFVAQGISVLVQSYNPEVKADEVKTA